MRDATPIAVSSACAEPLLTLRFGRMPADVTVMGVGSAPRGNVMASISQRDADAWPEGARRAGIPMVDTGPLYRGNPAGRCTGARRTLSTTTLVATNHHK